MAHARVHKLFDGLAFATSVLLAAARFALPSGGGDSSGAGFAFAARRARHVNLSINRSGL